MKPRSNMDGIWIGFDIFTGQGALAQPEKIVFWDDAKFKSATPEAPFLYSADALVGLSLVHLNKHLQNPFSTPKMNYAFAHESWQALEPHHALFTRSQPRVQALRDALKAKPSKAISAFERRFSEIVGSALEPWGLDLQHLNALVEAIDEMETHDERPLLYNFHPTFSRETLTTMHYLHSLAFHLRALIVMDHNAHVFDPAHEALKIDSISDYLPKADYVANDAQLYWAFKRIQDEMPKPARKKMEQAFMDFSHNGSALIENLPKSFLNRMNREQLDESLYLVQMDWLLGTDAGLLFRLREEIYGLSEGYDRVFYPDLMGRPSTLGGNLSVNCQITSETLYPSSDAA